MRSKNASDASGAGIALTKSANSLPATSAANGKASSDIGFLRSRLFPPNTHHKISDSSRLRLITSVSACAISSTEEAKLKIALASFSNGGLSCSLIVVRLFPATAVVRVSSSSLKSVSGFLISKLVAASRTITDSFIRYDFAKSTMSSFRIVFLNPLQRSSCTSCNVNVSRGRGWLAV